MFAFDKTLYKVHSNKQVGSWNIYVADSSPVILVRESCKVIGGKSVVTKTEYKEGKNIGRANETSPLEQAILEAESKVKKQLDKGYVDYIPDANDTVTNSLGFLKPMLATSIDKVKKWEFPVYIQPKFDGHRMLATVQDGEVVLYSRQGKILDVKHIQSQLQTLLKIGAWSGATLDGEVYLHGATLQRISSLVKKAKPESDSLIYNVYDIMVDKPFVDRFNIIWDIIGNTHITHVQVTETHEVYNNGGFKVINDLHAEYIGRGYEGTIIRHGDTGYEDGKRSKSLMKKKDFQDAEFEIVRVIQGKPKFKGKEVFEVAIYECRAENEKVFTVTSPGNMQEKHDAWVNRESMVGKFLTVKFFNLTPEGIPFHPVALRLREDI